MGPKRSVAIGFVVLLSIVVAGTVVAQSEASIERDAPPAADFNETITVEVTVVGDSLEESFNKDVDPRVVDADGGETTESADELNVTWTESGEYTVTYNITTPERRPLEINGTVSNSSTGATASSISEISLEVWYVDYTDENGIVDMTGLNQAVQDFLAGDLSGPELNKMIKSYLLEKPLDEIGS